MASEHDSAVLNSVSEAIIFAPFIVVGVLILLASALAILEAWSWLSYKFHEYRARRVIDDALAQNMENGMVENDPSPGDQAGSNTEELLKPTNAFIEERVWWAIYS